MGEIKRFGDPFGAGEALRDAWRAWLRHPDALALELNELAWRTALAQTHGWLRAIGADPVDAFPAVGNDERFQNTIWSTNPFLAAVKDHYLLYTRWMQDATYRTPGLTDRARRRAAFWQRQFLNALAPTNFFWTNPEAVIRFYQTGGHTLFDGLHNLLRDINRGAISMSDDHRFEVGENLAITPGAVVYRNELMELIQYAPSATPVHATPILLVAPWINKYYILDLAADNSLARFLVDQGFTVFVTSWKNPGSEMRHIRWEDYMLRGVLRGIDVVRQVCGVSQLHLAGYCLGGTMAATLLAWLSRSSDPDQRSAVAHWTLLTTLVDFAAPGDIEVYLDEPAVAYLARRMERNGYLDGNDMASAFRTLRSNSLIWRYFVHNYLYGETPPASDVLYWNMDTTRMPQTMHLFYLRELYLANRLIRRDDVYLADRPIDLHRIGQPLYCVGTEQDHIAPWQQVFKICQAVRGPTRFVLASSGHILGIINPPVQPAKRSFRSADATAATDPLAWRDRVHAQNGSWWQDWVEWLRPRCGQRVAPPPTGSAQFPPLAPAPGRYVLER